MRTTRTLLTAMAFGIGVSLGASAGLVYGNEFTTEWFDAKVQNLTPGSTLPTPLWTVPTEPGAVTVGNGKISLDTDFEDPLLYETPSAYSNVAVVAATFTVAPNAACPEIADEPQAALTVVANGGSTNWVGLVGDNGTNRWETFVATSDVPAPVAGETYSVSILFDQRYSSARKIRYLVGGKPLNDWVDNPKSAVSDISKVSFSGSGDITALAGTNIIETAATFDGQFFSTFDAALAAAEKGGWSDGKPVVLFKDATYEVKESGQIYINENGNLLTVSGGVFKKSGNTFTITKDSDCEAKIDEKYYATFAGAFDAASDGQTIEILKPVANVGALSVTKTLTLSDCAKLSGCTALTVSAGKTLTLEGSFAVVNATVNGSVAGDALAVSDTLTGTAVNSLTFANGATFAYVDTALAPATLTLPASGTVIITGIASLANGAPIITATELDAAKFTGAPNGRVFKVERGSLTLAPGATITETSEGEGFDFTNGTVSVTASVESGKTGTATLKVVDFATGVVTTYDPKAIGGDDLIWQLADELDGGQLTPGGTYSYVVEVEVDDVVVATKTGTFTAAKWPTDIWFGVDATSGEPGILTNGQWAEKAPSIESGHYVIEDDAVFNVDDQEPGSNHVTRVDAVVAFESLVDAGSLETESDALGGFVAAKSGDIPQWMALTSGDSQPSWVALTGALAPEANVQYVVRAEIDFISTAKRVRYLVSTDGTDFAPLALANGTQWLPLADADKATLAKVELKGAGSLVKFEARVADKALAEVNHVRYDSMEDAFEAAGTNGDYVITLLTNATVEPTKEGKYKISVGTGNYHYVSGGKESSGDKTIIVDEGGKPLVRPSDATMMDVKTPDGNSYQDYDSLRKFLEKNKVEGYTKDNATSGDISDALATKDSKNELLLWQDYALGIDVGTPVDPVTVPAGDTATDGITLSIPTVAAATPSGDYDLSFKVVDSSDKQQGDPSDKADEIKIPLVTGVTGKYRVKVIFTATPAPAN